MTSKAVPVLLAAGAVLIGAGNADARPARCFSTDDGFYSCNFKAVDGGGSFNISAPGKSSYTLYVDAPGRALGYLELGGRSISLPGEFVRRRDDPGCWVNDDTKVNICAW